MSSRSAVSVVFALVAACGRIEDVPPGEAAPGGVDAGEATASASVKVTVLSFAGDGRPDPTAKVIFLDRAGALVHDGPVDEQGHIEALLPEGGTVLALRVLETPSQLDATVSSIAEVASGDELTFGYLAGPPRPAGGVTNMTVTFPPRTGTATFYTPCGATRGSAASGALALTFRDSCRTETFDLVGVIEESGMKTYAKLTGIRYENGASFAIPGPFVAMRRTDLFAANLPSFTGFIVGTRTPLLGDLPIAPEDFFIGAQDTTGPAFYPTDLGTRRELVYEVKLGGLDRAHHYAVRTSEPGVNDVLDFAVVGLPLLANVDANLRGATWETAAPGIAPDGMLVRWRGTWQAAGRSVTVHWHAILPAGENRVVLPTLPATYAAFDPQQQSTAVTAEESLVILGEFDPLDGYAALKRSAEALLLPALGTTTPRAPSELGLFTGAPFRRGISMATTAPAL